jgi:hypothetical protein
MVGEKHHAVHACGVHDAADVVHAVLGGAEAAPSIGKSLPTPVEHHDSREGREPFEEVLVSLADEVERRSEGRDAHDCDRTGSHDRVRQLDTADVDVDGLQLPH